MKATSKSKKIDLSTSFIDSFIESLSLSRKPLLLSRPPLLLFIMACALVRVHLLFGRVFALDIRDHHIKGRTIFCMLVSLADVCERFSK